MVLRILETRSSTVPTLNYNYGKVSDGTASIVACHNLPVWSKDGIFDTFLSYENTRYPIKEVGFHLAVNPSQDDTCSEEELKEAIHKIMYHLGYKDQPYIIFRHNDIEREHYHVVSVRINKEGYKINNYYENKRMIDYARKIGPEYGFSINPSHDNSEKPERNPWMANDPVITTRFVPGKPVIEQLNGIFRNAMRYSFRSFDDLSAVLLRQGIRASLNQPADAKPYITLQGTNLKGKPVSEPISEGVAGQEWYESYRVRKDHNCLRANYTEKYSVSHCLQESYHRCSTAQGYVKSLHAQGIYPVVILDSLSNKPTIKFVDTKTRCVVDVDELVDTANKKLLLRALQVEGKENRPKSKLSFTAIARMLYPIGQPHGNSWSGRIPETREESKEKFEKGLTGSMFASFEDRRYEEKIK